MKTIKEVFVEHCHARFVKYFFYHMPFGNKEAYAKEVMKAASGRLTKLIIMCSFLLQRKLTYIGPIPLAATKRSFVFIGLLLFLTCF